MAGASSWARVLVFRVFMVLACFLLSVFYNTWKLSQMPKIVWDIASIITN
jgi:predicted membrane channel-forming protein YqfA (hemolysin III family)